MVRFFVRYWVDVIGGHWAPVIVVVLEPENTRPVVSFKLLKYSEFEIVWSGCSFVIGSM